jgi:hypothetical protein
MCACKRIFLFFSLVFSGGAACTHTITINSVPSEADIFIRERSVGRTPVTLDEKVLTSAQTKQGYQVLLKKEGYRDIYLVLPESYGKVVATATLSKVEVSSTKETEIKKLTAGEAVEIRQKIEKDLVKMLEEQLKIFSGDPADLGFLKAMQKDYPDSSLPLFLESLYLQKKGDSANALIAAENALLINPAENDYLTLIDVIRSSK